MHCSNCGDSYYVQLDYNPTARSHLTPSRRYLPIPEYAVPEYASPNLIIVCFFGNWRGRRYVFLQMRCMIDVWLTRLLAPASLVRPNVNQAEQLSADRCRLPLALHVPRSAQNVLHTSVGSACRRSSSSFASVSVLVLLALLLLQQAPPVRAYCALKSMPHEQYVLEYKRGGSLVTSLTWSPCFAQASDSQSRDRAGD